MNTTLTNNLLEADIFSTFPQPTVQIPELTYFTQTPSIFPQTENVTNFSMYTNKSIFSTMKLIDRNSSPVLKAKARRNKNGSPETMKIALAKKKRKKITKTKTKKSQSSNLGYMAQFFKSPITAPCKDLQYSKIGLRPYETWSNQVTRLNQMRTSGHKKHYSADVCHIKKSCAFFLFFAAQTPWNKEVLLSTSLQDITKEELHGHNKILAEYWNFRDKCCQTFTEINTQFGMLSQTKGMWYIAVVCVSIIMNAIMMVDIYGAKRSMQFTNFTKNFPLTNFCLTVFQHYGILHIVSAFLVQTILVHWSFTFWWEFSEQYCILFQYKRQMILIMNSMTITVLQITKILYYNATKCFSYKLIYILLLVWPFSFSITIPIMYAYEIQFIPPSQIFWHYSLHKIPIPPAVMEIMFSDMIIYGHFQCALPIQCMRKTLYTTSMPFKIYLFILHFVGPCVCTGYRVANDYLKTFLIRKLGAAKKRYECLKVSGEEMLARHQMNTRASMNKRATVVSQIRNSQPTVSQVQSVRSAISAKYYGTSNIPVANRRSETEILTNNNNKKEKYSLLQSVQYFLNLNPIKHEENEIYLYIVDSITKLFFLLYGPFYIFGIIYWLQPKLILKLDKYVLSTTITDVLEAYAQLYQIVLPFFWMKINDRVFRLLECEKKYKRKKRRESGEGRNNREKEGSLSNNDSVESESEDLFERDPDYDPKNYM